MNFETHDPEGGFTRNAKARRGFPAPPASADAASDPAGEPGVAGPGVFRRNFRVNSPLYT